MRRNAIQEEAYMPQVERTREIRRRRARREKMKALRDRLTGERDSRSRARIIAKIKKLSPTAPVPEK